MVKTTVPSPPAAAESGMGVMRIGATPSSPIGMTRLPLAAAQSKAKSVVLLTVKFVPQLAVPLSWNVTVVSASAAMLKRTENVRGWPLASDTMGLPSEGPVTATDATGCRQNKGGVGVPHSVL